MFRSIILAACTLFFGLPGTTLAQFSTALEVPSAAEGTELSWFLKVSRFGRDELVFDFDRGLAPAWPKVKWEALHADPRQLAQEKLDVARELYVAREKEFLAGRGTLHYLFAASRRLLESEQAVSDNDADRLSALERYLARAKLIEVVNTERYDAGRIAIQDYMEAKFHRLRAEMWLVQAGATGKNLGAGKTRLPPGMTDSLNASDSGPAQESTRFPDGMTDPLNAKEIAKIKFDTSEARLPQLAQEKLQVARQAYAAREEEFLAGRGTLDFLLEVSLLLLESERAISAKAADQVAALRSHWRRAKGIEDVNQQRHRDGRVSLQEYLQTVGHRMQAEVWLIQARPKSSKAFADHGTQAEQVVADPLNCREVAGAEFEATVANPKKLMQARLEVARGELFARFEQFRAGPVTLDFLLPASKRLLESELGVSDNRAEQVAALEQYWLQAHESEVVNTERYEAGRCAIQDYMEAKYLRLEAEIWLAEARAKTAQK
jgi:hypothetical protein